MSADTPIAPERYFAPDYFTARDQFLNIAQRCGARLARYPISAPGPGEHPLSIDTAYVGAMQPRRLILVVSGTHGAEGFFGSALQQRWLAQLDPTTLPADAGWLFVHALNPWGFAWRRRTNEHNVDLNRNSLEQFPGPANPAYGRLNNWLNPASPPGMIDGFWAYALWYTLTQGMATMKQAIAGGQYEFPRGIFYGGAQTEQSTAHLRTILCDPRLGSVERLIAFDLHTGLGRSGTYKLLVDADEGTPRFQLMRRWFGAEVSGDQPDRSVSYHVSGGVTEHISRLFAGADNYTTVLEFGTVALGQMIATLYRENRAYFHAGIDSAAYRRARAALCAVFCPADDKWRSTVLERGERVLRQAQQALFGAG
ncbi:MAG: DUF2817 domain-containing protein [Gammaproteobacteria bacterium]|nr:DUF2817 domain-containing protein [Gammaproteobacteria bacterium]